MATSGIGNHNQHNHPFNVSSSAGFDPFTHGNIQPLSVSTSKPMTQTYQQEPQNTSIATASALTPSNQQQSQQPATGTSNNINTNQRSQLPSNYNTQQGYQQLQSQPLQSQQQQPVQQLQYQPQQQQQQQQQQPQSPNPYLQSQMPQPSTPKESARSPSKLSRKATSSNLLTDDHLDKIKSMESKLDNLLNKTYDMEERIIHLEGGVIAVDSRLNVVESESKKTIQAMNNINQEVVNTQRTITDVVEPNITRLFTEKANSSDLRNKADVAVVLKKADMAQITRLDEITNDTERRVLVLSRDLEEGLETIQKKNDKKLEFMTQWIVKHVRKGIVPKEGEFADLGKTRCLVCDQPVKNIEKDTPFSVPGFRNTLGTIKGEKKTLPADETILRAGFKMPAKADDGKGNNTTSNTAKSGSNKASGNRNRSPSPSSDYDRGEQHDGPYFQRVYYTGGSTTGNAVIAESNNRVHSAIPLTHSYTVPALLHQPSNNALTAEKPETKAGQLGEFYKGMEK